MITNENFRRAEAFLANVGMPADVICSLIGLTLESVEIAVGADDHLEPDPIELSIAAIADRLGLYSDATLARLNQADGWVREHLGFRLGSPENPADGGKELSFTLYETFAAIIRGGTISAVASLPNDAKPDRAAIAEIGMMARAKASFLYRLPDTADDRADEIQRAATMIAGASPHGATVFGQSEEPRVSAGAAILAAILHGADTCVLTEDIFERDLEADEDWEDDNGKGGTWKGRAWRRPSAAIEPMLSMLRWLPLTLVVPIPRDSCLAPRVAAAFAGAVGPFRADRNAVRASLIAATDGRLGCTAADELASLWEGRPARAAAMLNAAAQMTLPDDVESFGYAAGGSSHIAAFSAATTTLVRSIEPHVWKPTTLVRPASKAPFFSELFHSDPDPKILFSAALRKERGIRILMLSPPGFGKTAAAAHVAKYSLGLDALQVQATDCFHYRLGHMEKAISRCFRQARENNCCLIFDEADSIAANRTTASLGSTNIVVSATNQLLVEMDRHTLPIIVLSNSGDRLDPAIKRRCDLVFDLEPIPEKLEARAMELILDLRFPCGSLGLDGLSAVSDYATAQRIVRLQELGHEGALAAVKRARDVRLGQHHKRRRIGF